MKATLPDPAAFVQYRNSLNNALTASIKGTVDSVVGQRVDVKGMSAPIGAICQIQTKSSERWVARVIGFQGDQPILSPFDDAQGICVGDEVQLLSKQLSLKVGPALLGRVIDALGRPLDGQPLPPGLETVVAECSPPESLQRPPIDTVYPTGVKVIDGLLTCGVGQRLGIFSAAGVGKSTLLAMLARGAHADAIVIGLVGERGREVREFVEQTLGPVGMQKSTLVVSTNDQSAAMRLQAAWTATSIASTLRQQGKNVLLLIDSVTRFATAQREIGLAAGEPPTTRGYPPSVFAQLPKLVEQAGRTASGAITAFYSVLVDGDDPNEPISDALRGLLDGHILLNRKLASEGLWPAI